MDPLSSLWEPRAQLLQAARSAGFKLSDPQLGRLHRAGLVPTPRTRALGRGKGTVSEFPAGSTARLLRVLEMQKRERTQKLSTLAWCLWWEGGGPLPALTRELLVRTADRWDVERTQLTDLLAREDAGDPDAQRRTEALYLALERDPIEGPLGTARRNAGRAGFASVARVFAEVAIGRFESYQDQEEPHEGGVPQTGTTGALVERALGLDHARQDRIGGSEPRFSGSSEAQLRILSGLLSDRQLAPVATTTPDHELDQARGEIRTLLTLIATLAPMVERVLGGDAAGYRTVARVLNVRTPRLQACMLLCWCVLRQDPELLNNLQDLIARLPQLLAAVELERLSHALAKEVPALGPALKNAARANLRGDTKGSARWRTEIREVSDEHREQVDRFFDRHPEVNTLISTVESANEIESQS